MRKETIKTFVKDFTMNITGEIGNKLDLVESIGEMLQIDDGSDEKLVEQLQKIGISDDLIPYMVMFKKCLDCFIIYLNESFESLHDSICSIEFQMHTDKIERAKQARKQFERALNTNNPSEDIKGLLRDFDGAVISNLYSDMKAKVDEIKKMSEKKRLFGYRKVRRDLEELKETLPVYADTIFLICLMRLYLGELSNAQLTIKDAQEKIRTLLPYEKPSENRMYTLTDENYWLEVSQKYCDEFEKYLHQMELLSVTKNKLIEQY